ncbi:MAG TPA: ChaB family protein [Acetobacteraceae bacterium]
MSDHLPPHAQDIFREAFNHAWQQHGGDEATAFRIAWAAVKRSYRKRGDRWVPIGR